MLVASIPSKQHVHPGTKALPTYDGLAGLVAHLRESHIVEIRKYQQARVKGKCQASSAVMSCLAFLFILHVFVIRCKLRQLRTCGADF